MAEIRRLIDDNLEFYPEFMVILGGDLNGRNTVNQSKNREFLEKLEEIDKVT